MGSNVAVPYIGTSSYAAFVSGAFIGCDIIVKIKTSFRHFNNEKLGVIALPDGHKLLPQDLMVFKGNSAFIIVGGSFPFASVAIHHLGDGRVRYRVRESWNKVFL